MDALKKNLNSIALTLISAGLVGWIVWPQKKVAVLVVGGLGLAALAVHVALNLSALKQSFRRRSFLYSGNLLLVIVLVLGILGLANYFLSKNHYRVDFTAAKLHSLSGQSVTVLKNLKSDIAFKCFFREGNYGRAAMENLLKIYAYHSSKVKFEFIDPDKNPGLVKRYDVTQDGTTIIEAGDKESRITTTSEEDVTNALIKATRAQKKVIYFLDGHGEETVEETGDNGYSTVKTELEKLGYEVKRQTLALADRFPKDAALLVIPGPQKDLLPNEYETIKAYLKDGGRVLFMVDPETSTLLPIFLSDYGFKLENDIVVDTVSRLLGGDYFMPVVSEYEPHAITDGFGYATFFPVARSVEIAETKPEGATLTALAKTSPNSWSERQLEEKEVKFTPDKDKQGPIGLAAVSSFKTKPAEPSPAPAEAKPGEPAAAEPAPKPEAAEKEARIAVVGDSDFAKNRYYGVSGNGNFFLNIANWLTEESDLIAIQPKTQTPRTIQLSPSQGRLLFLVSVVLLPLAVLALGVSVWVRRRSL
jgi:gliding motility-associatede transport system auxiliary component